MQPEKFNEQLDEAQIVAAIAKAERKTSGEIRVYVSHRKREDVLAAAQRRFRKLGMTKTRRRNAVLIYFAPLTRKFAIWGDLGVHEKCGQDLWNNVAGEIGRLLKQGHFTDAVVTAVKQVGEALAKHFPPAADDRNELSNEIAKD
ncbi:MAG: hypothetical protein DME26_09790 [Verrucomicrobia bacterium]|nr:MAG: hypothetical protein DME26_09790 [Verrucomicrobiota bacterium]